MALEPLKRALVSLFRSLEKQWAIILLECDDNAGQISCSNKPQFQQTDNHFQLEFCIIRSIYLLTWLSSHVHFHGWRMTLLGCQTETGTTSTSPAHIQTQSLKSKLSSSVSVFASIRQPKKGRPPPPPLSLPSKVRYEFFFCRGMS